MDKLTFKTKLKIKFLLPSAGSRKVLENITAAINKFRKTSFTS